MSLADINGALVQAYQAAGLGLATGYEGRDFAPAAGTSWAAVHHLPASTMVATLGSGGQDAHAGVFQVDVNAPDNVGTATLLASAQTLRAYFYAGRTFTYNGQDVRVKNSARSQIRHVDGWVRISVSVTYWAWTARP